MSSFKFTGDMGLRLLRCEVEGNDLIALYRGKEIARGSKQVFVWDSDTPGLGLRITRSRWTYIYRGKLDGKPVRKSLGTTDEMRAVEAKSIVKSLRQGKSAESVAKSAKSPEIAKSVTSVTRNPLEPAPESHSLDIFSVREAFLLYIDQLPGMEGLGNKLSKRTIKDVKDAMPRFGDWMDRPVRSIASSEAVKRHAELTERNGKAQANLAFRYLRAAFNYANAHLSPDEGDPLFDTNPADRIGRLKRWNRVKRRTTRIDAESFPAWWKATAETRGRFKEAARDYFRFLALTGCRPSEAYELEWEHVDLRKQVFTFVDTKNGDDLTLPMGPFMADMLRKRRKESGGERVFSNQDGLQHLKDPTDEERQPLPFVSNVRAIRRLANVTFVPTDLRREVASTLTEMRHSPMVVKTILNHRSRRDTDVTDGYTVPSDSFIKEVMVSLEEAVLRKAGQT